MPYSSSISFRSEPLEWKYSRYRSRQSSWSVQFCFMCSTCLFIVIVVGLMHYQILQHEWRSLTQSVSSSKIIVVDQKKISQRNGGDNDKVTITTRIVNGKLQKTITRGATKMILHGTNEDVLNRYIEHTLLKQSNQNQQQSFSKPITTSSIFPTKRGAITQNIVSAGSIDKIANPPFSTAPPFTEPTIPNIPPCHYKYLVIAGIDPHQDIPAAFTSRNLILGIAANIDIRNFAIFCGSLRHAGINATTILFMNEYIPEEHAQVAQKFNIILLVYDRKKLEPSFIRTYHPSSLRWILFDWFFTIKNGTYINSFDRVLSLDVRDSAFQTDPFDLFNFQQPHQTSVSSMNQFAVNAMIDHDKLFLFGENRFIAISTCNWNSGWIKDCFGERIFNLVKDQPISCSGVTMGGIKRIVNYFNKMSQILLNNFPCLASNSFPLCERNGVDQGVHNVLLHLQYLSPVMVKYSDDFPIVNLQSSPELMMDKSNIKRLIGEPSIYMTKFPGVKYAVVHQYDRDSTYQLLLGKKFLPSIDWESPIADWAQTEACTANFGVVFGADFLKGKCDSGASRGMTPAACCSACMHQRKNMIEKNMTKKGCTAFTFLEGVCYLKHCSEKEVKLLVGLITDPNFKDVTMTNMKAVSGYFKAVSV